MARLHPCSACLFWVRSLRLSSLHLSWVENHIESSCEHEKNILYKVDTYSRRDCCVFILSSNHWDQTLNTGLLKSSLPDPYTWDPCENMLLEISLTSLCPLLSTISIYRRYRVDINIFWSSTNHGGGSVHILPLVCVYITCKWTKVSTDIHWMWMWRCY